MKIIDLLNKIVNGEEVPKKIKYSSYIFKYTGDKRISRMYVMENQETYLFRDMVTTLTGEVEIIDEPKVGKLNLEKKEDGFLYLHGNKIVNQDFTFALKINEIIDEINKLKEK